MLSSRACLCFMKSAASGGASERRMLRTIERVRARSKLVLWGKSVMANPDISAVEWRAPSGNFERPRRIHCIINFRAGTVADRQREAVRQAFADCSAGDEIDTIVEICERPGFLSQIVRRAISSGADVIVAGGGDGTISTVANQLVGTDVSLGVLPLGTLNHFAKDLGIPLDLSGAIEAICRGVIK